MTPQQKPLEIAKQLDPTRLQLSSDNQRAYLVASELEQQLMTAQDRLGNTQQAAEDHRMQSHKLVYEAAELANNPASYLTALVQIENGSRAADRLAEQLEPLCAKISNGGSIPISIIGTKLGILAFGKSAGNIIIDSPKYDEIDEFNIADVGFKLPLTDVSTYQYQSRSDGISDDLQYLGVGKHEVNVNQRIDRLNIAYNAEQIELLDNTDEQYREDKNGINSVVAYGHLAVKGVLKTLYKKHSAKRSEQGSQWHDYSTEEVLAVGISMGISPTEVIDYDEIASEYSIRTLSLEHITTGVLTTIKETLHKRRHPDTRHPHQNWTIFTHPEVLAATNLSEKDVNMAVQAAVNDVADPNTREVQAATPSGFATMPIKEVQEIAKSAAFEHLNHNFKPSDFDTTIDDRVTENRPSQMSAIASAAM